jgi:hypothetical protein
MLIANSFKENCLNRLKKEIIATIRGYRRNIIGAYYNSRNGNKLKL